MRQAQSSQLVQVQNAREAAELHKMAINTLMRYREKMEESLVEGDIKALAVYQQGFKDWWDRVGKFHFAELPGGLQIVGNNIQVNAIQVLLEEVKNNPDIAARVTARLSNNQAADGPQEANSPS